MKTIDDGLKSDIEDAAAGNLLGPLPAAVAEKDIHITDALRALSEINLTHTAHQRGARKGDGKPRTVEVGTHLVFAGGTCLSKAHGLIQRMSEDIDIKVVLDEPPEGYAFLGGLGDRSRLKALHATLRERLEGLGFELTQGETENPLTRDIHRYHCLSVAYRARFSDVAGVLRPTLKVELIHRHPLTTVTQFKIGCLLDTLVGRQGPRFTMRCFSVAETLAEKVLSFLRRCAWRWDGYQRNDFDETLVRHIYDVWRIASDRPETVDEGAEVFDALIKNDAKEFRGQHPGFDQDPHAVLRAALATAQSHNGIRENFERRLIPLLYAPQRPTFDECLVAFTGVAERFLATRE